MSEYTEPEQQQDEKDGEPTEAAKTLHGDQAVAEQYPQPETVDLDSSTKIAVPEQGNADGE